MLSIVFLSACNKNFPLFSNNTNKFNHNDLDYEYVALKSKIKISAEDKNLRLTANIRMKKDSVIWISLSPGFGVEAARALITKDSVFILDKIHREYDKRSISQLTGDFDFGFELGMVESILLGNLIYPIAKEDKIQKSQGSYNIKQQHGDINITDVIGAKTMKLEQVTASSEVYPSSLEMTYSDFQQLKEKVYPAEINIGAKYLDKVNKSEKNANITIRHTKVEIDEKKYSFAFSIPQKYARRKN